MPAELRRVQIALGALVLGGSGYQVGLAVVAFRSGGGGSVGLAFAVQILPPALAAPFVSALADRFPRQQVMVAIDVLRTVCTCAVALVVAHGASLGTVLALGAAGAIASTAYAPATRALLPALVDDPEDLASANVVASAIEHGGLLVGPALAGVLVAAAGPEWSFMAGAALFYVSALLVAGVRVARPVAAGHERFELLAGLTALRSLRGFVATYGAVMFAFGALQVLLVVVAQDLTGLGESGVGILFAAFGAGGLAGSFVALRLKRRLALALTAGVALWAGPLVLLGALPGSASAIGGLAVIGLANILVDVAIVTLLQRAVPDAVLARAFGVLETVLVLAVGLGSVAAPLLIDAAGVRGALVALAVVPLLAVALPRPAEPALAAVLRRLRMFEALPEPALEALAQQLVPVQAADGEVVIRRGDAGDRFYVIDEGTVEVAGRTLGPGEGFGEIALLRDVPRTATVTARGPVRLYALAREPFLRAVVAAPPAASSSAAPR